MINRVVITGLGVVAPNGIGLNAFEHAMKQGQTGIAFYEKLKELNFGCQVAGVPKLEDDLIKNYFSALTLKFLKSSGIMFGCIAGMDAWKDAGLEPKLQQESPDWDSGTIFGTGLSGIEPIIYAHNMVDEGKTRRLGSSIVEQTMASGPSAYLGGILGLGNQVTTNSSACSTGAEAIAMAFERIKDGKAKRMLAGSCDSYGPYIWAGFDAMRVLNRNSNGNPQFASRPMSASASGFVPGAGAGALVLENLESAISRGARIYAEIIGAATNSGGQRNEGTMTAPNPIGVQRCIHDALKVSGVNSCQIDAISGHLTSTMGDVLEISNWVKALDREGTSFPFINAPKSMIGHCLGAAGSIECVALVLQLFKNFFHPSLNCEDVHPQIAEKIDPAKIPQQVIYHTDFEIIAKSSFGFGDVNCCLIFKKWN